LRQRSDRDSGIAPIKLGTIQAKDVAAVSPSAPDSQTESEMQQLDQWKVSAQIEKLKLELKSLNESPPIPRL
jgi:hypothetical protein